MMEFFTQKDRKAKKMHVCEFCKKEIIPGERYSYESGKFDGDFFVRKLCIPCYNMLCQFTQETRHEEFQWDWVQDWLRDNYCAEECKQACGYGLSKIQCCPIIRGKFTQKNNTKHRKGIRK